MIKLTLGQARGPVAEVAGDTGMPVTNERVTDVINNAIEELMQEGEYPGIVDRWHLEAVDGNIVLPAHLDRLMQITIRGVPQTVASPWFQFVAYGPGNDEDQCGYGRWWCDWTMVEDRGEHPTHTSIPGDVDGPWVLRVYTSVSEITDGSGTVPYCTIQGLDPDGLIVRSQISDGSGGAEWINGVRVDLNSAVAYEETVQEFSEITAFTKPQTNGYIRITAWNGTTEIELSNYEPDETTPSYHRYWSRWLNMAQVQESDDGCVRRIRARCWRRFVKAREETDVLLIGNIQALKEMVIAQWKRQCDDYEGYLVHKQAAVDIMNKEASRYRGKSRIPAMSFQRGFSVGSDLPHIQ